MQHDMLRDYRYVLKCVVIGLAAGVQSGLFGVGGGTIIVPMLSWLLVFDQRKASATSLAAIVPTAAVGVISYAAHDSVAWIPALLLAVGAVIGAQIGTWLSAHLPERTLRWFFVCFLLVVVATLFTTTPSRDSALVVTVGTAIGMIGVGLAMGILSGLLGVGGGVIVVPAMMLLFGASDLVARGTSLLTMLPAAISGTIANARRHTVDLSAAAFVGLGACASTSLGVWIATLISPLAGNILFAALMLFIAGQMAWRLIRSRKPRS